MPVHRAIVVSVAAAAVAAGVCACESNKISAPRNPVSPSCAFNTTLSTLHFSPSGGTATASVTTASGCSWTATSLADWITVQGTASGVGPGMVTLLVAPTTASEERRGSIEIASQPLVLTQSACEFKVQPAERVFGPDGGTGEIEVVVQDGCRWTIDDRPAWAAFDPASGDGAARVVVRVGENQSSEVRDATVRIGSARIKLSQTPEDPPTPVPPAPSVCRFRVDPVRMFALLAGGTAEFTVTADPGCAWTATPAADWIALRSGMSGSGSGRVVYDVSRAPSGGYNTDFRKAPIEVRWAGPTAGENMWIWQFPDCHTAFAERDTSGYITNVNFDAAGGSRLLWVLTESPFRCPWAAQPPTATWISLRAPFLPQYRTGDGDITITVPPNPSTQARTAVLIVGEKPLTVTQAGR